MRLKIKRVYEDPEEEDGIRILVDRLWPRGMTKEKAHIDIWLRDIGPSTGLRKWFGHEPDRWNEFKEKYIQELKSNKEQISLLNEQLNKGKVTILYGAKDTEHNEAVVIEEYFNDEFLYSPEY